MKKILLYGDSNTFGLNPKSFSRYNENSRWSGIIKEKLKNKYEVLEEGANNRTGFAENSEGEFYSSQKYFPKLLKRTGIIDIIVIAIGTNDLQFQYDISSEETENGLNNLVEEGKKYSANIILIPPVILDERILNGFFKTMFDETSIQKSKEIGQIYKKTAEKWNCYIFDINEFAKGSDTDGLHYTEESHKLIAEKLLKFLEHKIFQIK